MKRSVRIVEGARKVRAREKEESEGARLSFCPKLWHGTSRSTSGRQRALVDLFGVVEMLIGELSGLAGCRCCRCFLHKLPPKERSGVRLARFSGLPSIVEGPWRRVDATHGWSRLPCSDLVKMWGSLQFQIDSEALAG